MAFSFAGAGAGASDALQQLLAQRMEQQLAQARLQAQQQAQADQVAQQERQFGLQQQQETRMAAGDKADEAYRTAQMGRQTEQDNIAAADRRQTQNQRGVRSMVFEGLRAKTTDPRTAQLMAAGEGVDIDPDVLDPERGNKEWERREGIEHTNRLGEIAESGRQAQRTAATRTSGTRDAAMQRRIDARAKAFDSQPAVKRAQALGESATFAVGLNPNTTNPADDQALIYNFAKSMDPDSAVREGEYATIQKYAQSMAERFGFSAARVFSNTAFLTPEARQNIKDTILARFDASRGQYEGLRKSYVDRLTTMGGGEDDLTDYGAGFPSIGGGGGAASASKVGEKKKFPNGRTATFDGKGWVAD